MDDTERAIQLKNGALMGGRKIRVKLAMHRLPLELRKAKANNGYCFLSQCIALKSTPYKNASAPYYWYMNFLTLFASTFY